MAETIKEFLISYGYSVDDSSRQRAEAATKASEARITEANAAALRERVDADNRAQAERIRVALATGQQLTADDRRFVLEQEKARTASAERDAKRETEAGKAARERRETAFKQLQADFLRISSVASTVSAGISGLFAASPLAGFVVGVERAAGSMSRLAIQSQRVSSSAAGIERYMYAMGQAGVDPGEASGALEGFAAKMKTNPEGYRQALERLGVKTTGADGKPLGYDEMLENFGGYLSSQPYNLARVQAGAFGVNGDNALNALRDQGNFNRNLGAYDDKLKAFGLDPNKVSEDARKVEQAYGEMQANLRIVNLRVQSDFFLPMMQGFNNFSKWLEEHPNLTENLERGLVAFSAVMTARVLPVIARLVAGITGLSGITLSPALLAALGLAASTTSANTGEPTIRPDGSSVYPDGHVVPGKVWDGHSTGTPYVPPDNRNWWQRNAPTWAGGQDAPTANRDGVSEGGGARLRQRRGSYGPDANLPVGNVPGATGYGAINAYWKGPLDKRGEGGHTGPQEMFSYLKSQGATDNEALLLTGSAASESSFNPYAVHDGGRGHGLFGHNDARLDMRGKNWQQQSVMALEELRHTLGRSVNAARTPEELTDVEMHNERPRGYKPNNPRAGDNYMGRLNSIRRFSVMTSAGGSPAPTGPVGDRAAFDAQQRMSNGQAQPDDAGLVSTYRQQQNTPQLAGGSGGPVKVDVVRQPLDPARQKLADAMNADMERRKDLHQHIVDLGKKGKLDADFFMRGAGRHHALGYSAINASRTHNERHGDSFVIHARNAQEGADAAMKVSARRGEQDKVRYGTASTN